MQGVPGSQQQQQQVPAISQALSEDVAYDGIIADVPPKPSSLYVRVSPAMVPAALHLQLQGACQ